MSLSILLFDTAPETDNHYLVLAIADALRRHTHVSEVTVGSHRDALRRATDKVYDILLAFGGTRPHTALLSRLSKLVRCSMIWTTEDPYEVDANRLHADIFDVVFTNDLSSVSAYERDVEHLPLAASRMFQYQPVIVDEEAYRYDLLFIGTAWPNRVASLNTIMRALPGSLKCKIALAWNEYIGPPNLEGTERFTNWRCSNRDFARLANRSRVVLTLPRRFSGSNDARAEGSTPPPRLFETALAGGFQIVVGQSSEVRDYYEAETEIGVCDTDAGAIEVIRQYLDAPQRRIAAAVAAQERTLREHLYDHRVGRLLDTASEFLRSRRSRHSLEPSTRVPAAPRSTVLILSHNRLDARPGGGVEVYQEALTTLAQGFKFIFLYPVLHSDRFELRLEGKNIQESFDLDRSVAPSLSDKRVEQIFEEILFRHRVDLIHVQHLLHLPLSLPIIAGACGVPVVYHLHDHFLVCEHWLLLDHRGAFCDVVERGSGQCDACLLASNNYPPGSKRRRDAFVSLVVRSIDRFVTSTPSTGDYLRRFYPEIEASQIVEIPMLVPGTEPERRARPGPASPPRDDAEGPLVVAVIGGVNEHKGGDALIELMRLCADRPIRFEIFGLVSQHHQDRIRGLPGCSVRLHGAYEQSAIVALLAGCDVSLHLSTWPETYVLALTEAWQAGLVPIVSDIGALRERVTDGVDGFLIRPHHPGGVLERLIDLHLDRGQLARMRATVVRKHFPAPGEHLDRIATLYRDLIAARPCPHDRIPGRVRGPFQLALADLGIRLNADTWISSDIGWDPTPAVDTGLPPVPRSASMEAADTALPLVQALSTDPRTHFSLDAFRLDDRAIDRNRGSEVALSDISVRGWFRHDDWPIPVRAYLRLVDAASERYLPLTPEARHDLVQHFSDKGAENSGFHSRIDLRGIATGSYSADLVQIANGRRLLMPNIVRFFVAAGIDVGKRERWWRRPRPARSPDLIDMTVEQQNLPSIDGLLVGTHADDWLLTATLDACPGLSTKLRAILWNEESEATYAVNARIRTAPSDGEPTSTVKVGFLAELANVRPGIYRLGFLGDDEDANVLSTSMRIEIVAGTDPCLLRERAASPDWLRRRVARTPEIWDIERVPDPADMRGRSMVRCRGWAFARGHGPLLSTNLYWREAGERNVSKCAPLPGPRTAARSNEPDSAACGFSVVFPSTFLNSGTIRFIQEYERGVVEYTYFRRALRKYGSV